jgi:hypothetical protein
MKHQQYDSKAERIIAPLVHSLAGERCNTFGPYLSTTYCDAAGVELEGRPDFSVPGTDGPIFIEVKSGKLNFHRTQASSREALASAYQSNFHRCAGEMTHSQLSKALYESRAGHVCLDHGWNHSVFKLAALQAQHGWQRYIVCFDEAPTRKEAAAYAKAGLVWCSAETPKGHHATGLEDMVLAIRLLPHGFKIPYLYKKRTYAYAVEPTAPASHEATRTEYLARVEAHRQESLSYTF